jgi:membrane protease YdiL (CAAX protease family)
MCVFSGWSIFASVRAAQAGFPVPRFDDKNSLLLVAYELVAFLLIALFISVRGWRLRDFNLRVSWLGFFIGALLFGGTWVLHIAVWDLFAGQPAARGFMVEMVAQARISLPVAVLLSIVNGAYEEIFLTGYLLKALQVGGALFAIGASALIRLLTHIYQGPLGALSVLFFGLVLTLFYWRYRQLWPVVSAHAIADFLAFAQGVTDGT